MITSIEIENLRGIRTGKLEGLAPLTILTGPNACGKSTVLDALLIGASPNPADDVGLAVKRHPTALNGTRWLFFGERREAFLTVGVGTQESWIRRLEWSERAPENLRTELLEREAHAPFSCINVSEFGWNDPNAKTSTAISADNKYRYDLKDYRRFSTIPMVRLVDTGIPAKLDEEYTNVVFAGRRELVNDLVALLVPGFDRLEILALTNLDYGLAVTCKGRSIPVSLSGDGIQAFLQLALQIAEVPEGLVLVEEPEVYQHPKAIWQSARALLANMRRGVQMVITTHSLELIDALISESSEEDREKMALFNLALEDGELKSGRRSGEEMRFARQTLENDLR